MTSRAKPVVGVRRSRFERPSRNTLLNIGFGLVVVVALLVLAIAAFLSWYDANLASVASVNGQGITKQEFQRRYDVEEARLSIAESRILDEYNAGRLTSDQRDAQQQFLGQRQQQLPAVALERLIDARVQAELAVQESVQVTDADVEAQIQEEATRPEQRFAWIIAVEPELAEGATEPTAAAKTAARTKAEGALRDLEAGKDWVEVAKAVSTDSTASLGGELGWVSEDFDADEAFSDAVFAIEKGQMTELIEGDDGTWRIGRVTDVVAESVEGDYRALMSGRGVPRDVYEEAVRQDVVGEKLREKIEGLALAVGPQRRVSEIFLENPALPEALPQGSVKTRHILISPKDDPQAAGELPAEDPAWKAAEDEARKLYDELKADTSKFDAKARAQSDEGSAEISGGKLPWFDPGQVTAGQLDPAFGAAIFKEGLQPGQVLEPVKSDFGWHVIQVMYFPTDEDQAKRLKQQIEGGAKFEDLARDFSAGAEAEEGGEIGFVGHYQLDPASEAAIFATPIGKVSDPVSVDGDGVHLYFVHEEVTRAPEAEQKDAIEASAFSNWYEAKKAAFTIERHVDLGG